MTAAERKAGVGSMRVRTLADLYGVGCSQCSRRFGLCSHCQWERKISIKSMSYVIFVVPFPVFPLFCVDPPKEATERRAISLAPM